MEDKNKILEIFYRIKGRGSKNTLEQYQRNLKFFFDFLDKNYGVNYLEVKAYMLIDFEDYISKNKFQDRRYKEEHLIEFSMETQYSLMKSVSGLYSWLYENDYITKDLAKGIDLKKFKSKEHHDIYLNRESVKLLIQYLNDDSFKIKRNRCEDFNKSRDLFAYALLTKYGNRIGELQTLTFSDLDLLNNKITIKAENRKNKTQLINKLDGQIKEFYNKYMLERKKRGITSDLIYTSQNGKPLYRSNINNGLRKRLKESNIYAESIGSNTRIENIDDMTIHKLRHTSAYLMIGNGVPIEQVASVLGQKQVISVTKSIYGHTNNMEIDTVQL